MFIDILTNRREHKRAQSKTSKKYRFACRKSLSAANNQKEHDKSDKSLIVDIRTLLEHQKRSIHWLIILATALICRSVILKKSEI